LWQIVGAGVCCIVVTRVHNSLSYPPTLRIGAGAKELPDPARSARIGAENHESSVAAAREGFALLVSTQLQGGPAAILTPERRRRLVAGACRGGLTPFDANLVIAMVQHDSRLGGLSPDTHRLPEAGAKRNIGVWQPAVLAAAIGVAIFLLLRRWLLG